MTNNDKRFLTLYVLTVAFLLGILCFTCSGCAAIQTTSQMNLTEVSKRYDWDENYVLDLTIEYDGDYYEYRRTIRNDNKKESCLTTVVSGWYNLNGIDNDCDNNNIMFYINYKKDGDFIVFKKPSSEQEKELILKIKYMNQSKQIKNYVKRWKDGLSLDFDN